MLKKPDHGSTVRVFRSLSPQREGDELHGKIVQVLDGQDPDLERVREETKRFENEVKNKGG